MLVFIPSIEDGGVEKNLYIILNFLSKKIDDVVLLTFDGSKNKLFDKKIKILNPFFNFNFFKGRYPKYLLCLLYLVKILIFNKNFLILSFQANIYVLIISRIFNTKVVSRSNSSSTGWSRNFIKKKIFSYFIKKADNIIVNSSDFKIEMDKKYNINTTCILNPFIFENIKKKSNVKVRNLYPKNSLRLITVGRLTKQKDFLTMLKAIKLVKKRKVFLIIIGKGSEEDNLKNFIRENKLLNKVKFIGYQSNPFKYIKQAEIFLLTSVFEGSPNVLVEAQYLKRFIISTNCPTGPREILNNKKNGDLVEVGDYNKISKLLENYKFNSKIKSKILLGFNNTKKYHYKKNCIQYYNLIKKFLK